MSIHLLPDEKLVASLDRDAVVLTNQRLQLIADSNYRIIQLYQISFIEVEVKYHSLTLVVAVVVLLGGFAAGDEGGAIFGIILFCILMALYVFLPKRSLLVRSSGGTISHRVNGIKNSDIHRFIFLVQEQMNKVKKYA